MGEPTQTLEPPRAGAETVLPRRVRGAARQRGKRRRAGIVLGAAVAVIAAGVAVALVRAPGADDRSHALVEHLPPAAGSDRLTTTLLYGTSGSGPAVWLDLIALDPGRRRAVVTTIPAHTAAEIPGRGLQPVGSALESGDGTLLELAVENLMRVEIDRSVELPESGARTMFERTGEIVVDVPREVEVSVPGGARAVLVPGRQRLGAGRLTTLLYTPGAEGNDLDLAQAHLAFWSGLFETFAADPTSLQEAIESGLPELGDPGSAGDTGRLLGIVAALGPERRDIASLPVEGLGAGRHELYEADREEVGAFVRSTLQVEPQKPVRIHVLNGVGGPGMGEAIARDLREHGFAVVLSGNARTLDVARTRIVAYGDDDRAVRTARKLKRLLGVGRVQVSAQRRGIVDVTIVVGNDYLRGK